MKRRRLSTLYADYAGIIAAAICLIHCLAAPLVLGAAAHSHEHAHHPEGPWYLHRGWDFVFLGIGLMAVRYSARHSHHRWMKWLLWGTFASLAMSVLLEASGEIFRYMVYVASAALISAHVFQLLRWRRRPFTASPASPSPQIEARQVLRHQDPAHVLH
jgi:uncharacterized BrkB/YihY/UPF0761 family membrane protein